MTSGRFVLVAMQPGLYTMRAELAGFQTQTRTGIRLGVGQAITIAYTLAGRDAGRCHHGDRGLAARRGDPDHHRHQHVGAGHHEPAHAGARDAVVDAVGAGLTPHLDSGNFEGATYSANGREDQSNLFLVDGVHNKDDRGGAFTQVSMTIDAFSEYNVMTHDYGAEYGGASGVIVNAVTKSGTNQFHGSGYYYGQDDRFNAPNYFSKLEGRAKPESGNDIVGASIGGPILRNKAFFFFNTERQWLKNALDLKFPAEAAPLATSFASIYDVNLTKYFGRVDYQLTPSHNFSFRTIWNPNTGVGEVAESEQSIAENFRYELAKERINNFQWTAVLGSRMLNEVKVSSTYEALKQAARDIYGGESDRSVRPGRARDYRLERRRSVGLRGAAAASQLPGGPAGGHGRALLEHDCVHRAVHLHARQAHVEVRRRRQQQRGDDLHGARRGGGPFGQFNFLTDRNFDPADPFTYPTRFRIRVGDMFFKVDDWRTNFYVADKWQATDKLTLNLGLRYDYSNIVPDSKDALAPRLGVAYATSDKMVFRGGVGKFYEPARNQFMYQVLSSSVIGSAYTFDTGTDRSATRGQCAGASLLESDGRRRRARGDQPRLPGPAGGPAQPERGRWRVPRHPPAPRDPEAGLPVVLECGRGASGHAERRRHGRLRRQRRARSNGHRRHQRRAARVRRGGDLPGHRRVRSDGHADSGGGARRELPARLAVSDAGRLQHRLSRAGAEHGEADGQPLVRARELLAVTRRAMSMSSPEMPIPSGTGGSTTITA